MVNLLGVWFLGVLAAVFVWGILTGYNVRRGRPDWSEDAASIGIGACLLWPLTLVVLTLMGAFVLGELLIGGKK